MSYADKFGLKFLKVVEGEDAPVVLKGKVLNVREKRKLGEELHAALMALTKLAEGVDADEPWLSPDANGLDRRSLAS
jgi:hypothetical protein